MSDQAIDRAVAKAAQRTRWAKTALDKNDRVRARSYVKEADQLLQLVDLARLTNPAAQFVH